MATGDDDSEFELCTTEPDDTTTFVSNAAGSNSAPELLCEDGKKWPKEGPGNIILRVFFIQQPPPETSEDKILEVMREWSKHCGVRFERAKYLDQSEIRISFEAGSSFSVVGTDANLPEYKKKRTMNLGRVNERTILHETGHALGLVHEHQHPEGKIQWDQDKLIEDLCDSGPKWSPERIKRNIIVPYKKSQVKGTKKIDPDSIMAYNIKKRWVKNASHPGIELVFKHNTKLSTLDKEKISEVYPKPTIDMDSDSSGDNENSATIHDEGTKAIAKPRRVVADEASEINPQYPDVSKPVDANMAREDKQPDFLFDEKHLGTLFRFLLPVASSWITIGQALDVPRLETTAANYSNNVQHCLRDMLSTWLKQIKPRPSKQRLVATIENDIKNPKLADEINCHAWVP